MIYYILFALSVLPASISFVALHEGEARLGVKFAILSAASTVVSLVYALTHLP